MIPFCLSLTLLSACGRYDDLYSDLAFKLVGAWEGKASTQEWCATHREDGTMEIRVMWEREVKTSGQKRESIISWNIREGTYEVVKGKRLIYRLTTTAKSAEQVEASQRIKEAIEQTQKQSALTDAESAKAPSGEVEQAQMYILDGVNEKTAEYSTMNGQQEFKLNRVARCAEKFKFETTQ